MPNSVTKGDSYAILGSYTATGPSQGSASCSSNVNGTVTDTSQLAKGSHTITCTATTGAGKKVSDTKTIQITWEAYNATNLVTNGSFENGIDEWQNRDQNEIVTQLPFSDYSYIPQRYGNYAISIQVNNNQSFLRTSYDTTSTLANHKVYANVSALIDQGDINPGLFVEFSNGPEYWSEPASTTTTWYNQKCPSLKQREWCLLSSYETAAYNYLKILLVQGNINVTGTVLFDGLIVVDLTETFGPGNEPNQEWCDKHINYFDGTTTIYK